MRLVDLTGRLEAARRDVDWPRVAFLQLLERLAGGLPGSSVDWDSQAGEEWGRVLLRGEVVSLLWLRGAFAFLDVSHADVLSPILRNSSVHFEAVGDWEEARYKVDRRILIQLSGRGELSEGFDPAAFSANELWWATV